MSLALPVSLGSVTLLLLGAFSADHLCYTLRHAILAKSVSAKIKRVSHYLEKWQEVTLYSGNVNSI